MKHISKLFSILLIILCFSSCKKEAEKSPTIIDTSEYFKCKLNNKDYVDDARFANYFFGLTKIVSQNDFELFRIDLEKDSLGTFIISESNPDNGMLYIDSNSIVYDAVSGVINVTEFDKSKKILSGTFSGVFKNANNVTINVTEGKFNYLKVSPL